MSTESALRECLISPSVMDANFESANVVDVLLHVAKAGKAIANAITPVSCGSDDSGNTVECLTEAAMSHTRQLRDSLGHIDESISSVAKSLLAIANAIEGLQGNGEQ